MGLIEDLNYEISKLETNILLIDESNYNFRSNIENWTFYSKNGIQRNNTYAPNIARIARQSVINQKDDGLKEFFLNKRSSTKTASFLKDFIEIKADMSSENRRNLNLSLIHTLLYMFNYAIILPSCFLYIESITNNTENGILSGCILSLSPLCSIFSQRFIFNKSKSYKLILILSIISVLIANILYAFAFYFETIYLIVLSQMFLGFGNFRIMNRHYLIRYVPKPLYNHYTYSYLIYNGFGLILGKKI